MGPYDYSIGGADPVSRTLQGYRGGLATQQGIAQEQRMAERHPLELQTMQQGLDIGAAREARAQAEFEQQQAAAAEAKARQEAFRTGFMGLIEKGPGATFEDVATFAGQFPELADSTMQLFDQIDEGRRKPLVTAMGQAMAALKSGSPEVAQQVMQDFSAAARDAGDVTLADQADAAIELFKVSPETAAAQLGVLLYSLDPDMAQTAMGGGSKVLKSEILPDGTTIQSTDGGLKVIAPNGETLTGEAAAARIKEAQDYGVDVEKLKNEARESGKLDARGEGARKAKAEEKSGELQIKFVESANNAAEAVGKNIGNLNRAIAALDAGGKSGSIQKMLPDITQASAELRNAMNSLGLDVVGSVTFGALSEGELKLAMDVAVPQNLDEPELKAWLQDRVDAQRKVRVALQEQAAFLADTNNSLSDWYEKIGVEKPGGEQSGNDDAAFIAEMKAQKARGEAFTPEQKSRIEKIMRGAK